MASISTNKKTGLRRILFKGADGKRRPIHLGKMPLSVARTIKSHVEHLAAALLTGDAPPPKTSEWVGSRDSVLYDKLAAVGLVPSREAKPDAEASTLGKFCEQYIDGRQDVRPDTKIVWRHVKNNLLDFFGSSKPLGSIIEADADAFKQYLLQEKLAMATVAKRLQVCRMIFKAAMRARLIATNPFQDVTAPATVRPEKFFFVTRDMTKRLLDACPDVNWRLFVALGRYGGFRVPSEACSLRWQDILWDQDKIVVPSPKGERYGKGERIIPLFPELRPILSEAFDQAQEGDVYCIEKFRRFAVGKTGWVNCSLGSRFSKIVQRAGLTRWPRLFHALRASRETELAQEFPVHVVTAWLGNTPKIALKHYLMTTDADFQRAVGGSAKSSAPEPQKTAQKRAQPVSADAGQGDQETHKALANQGFYHVLADVGTNRQATPVAAVGFEPTTRGL